MIDFAHSKICFFFMTSVPFQYPTNPRLGLWVSYQRSQYNNNNYSNHQQQQSFLTSERIEALNQIEFSWKEKDNEWMDTRTDT